MVVAIVIVVFSYWYVYRMVGWIVFITLAPVVCVRAHCLLKNFKFYQSAKTKLCEVGQLTKLRVISEVARVSFIKFPWPQLLPVVFWRGDRG